MAKKAAVKKPAAKKAIAKSNGNLSIEEPERRLIVRPPSADEKGHFFRLKSFMDIQLRAQSKNGIEVQAEAVDEMIEFVLDRVIEPKDRDEAREMLTGEDGLSLNEVKNIGKQIASSEGDAPLA